jgi:nicotinate-nucleotide adenylyltransferase
VGRRIGVFGGSFDPIHYGHLLMAEQCREQARLDRVLFVPASQSPLKSHAPVAEAKHRVEMLKLATAGHTSFAIETAELDRPGPSFTVDTLRELAQRAPGDTWHWIVGSDSFREFHKWREPSEILNLAIPLVVARPGHTTSLEVVRSLVSAERWSELQGYRIETPLLDISSSDMRRRVAEGRSIRYMTARAVEMYIQTHALYRSK